MFSIISHCGCIDQDSEDLRALTAAASGASDAAARSIRHSRTLGRAALADRLARQRAASAVRQRRAERRRLTARALPSGCVRALDETMPASTACQLSSGSARALESGDGRRR